MSGAIPAQVQLPPQAPVEPMAWAATVPFGYRATGRAADGTTYEGPFRVLQSAAERDAEWFVRAERATAQKMRNRLAMHDRFVRTLRVRDVFPPREG